ncbi:MAG: bromoperoxidase [Pseudomonadota bacterium]
MKLPFSEPSPSGSERARQAKRQRDLATEVSRLTPQARTQANGEENDHGGTYPANFTKGLLHNQFGIVSEAQDYRCFVEAINSEDSTLFEKAVPSALDRKGSSTDLFNCKVTGTCSGAEQTPDWRGWESPRSGHSYDLQGPDAGAVGMAPAPRVGSSELSAEMAEVYGLALLRDVPFSEIMSGGDAQLIGSDFGSKTAAASSAQVAQWLGEMAFYSGLDVVSSTPHNYSDGLNRFELNRRAARPELAEGGSPKPENLYRGSTKGSQSGPYLSQFMLIGANSLGCAGGGQSSFPAKSASWDIQDGFIPYGTIPIDQRTVTHKNGLDYMTDWTSWLDVQNGANMQAEGVRADQYEAERRFITTPRDLATYVHFDALYEAYLNAALVLLAMGTPHSKGFPEPSPKGTRTAFVTFGGPHILSLVCEVATRCLKAVRRQKFNYHRRARPEALGGRLTLANLGKDSELGSAAAAFADALADIPAGLQAAIVAHNNAQNLATTVALRNVSHSTSVYPGVSKTQFKNKNLLLPMAFPEGSPMHPAYGAGHATVAGGCVTVLKAFFEMFEGANSFVERPLYCPESNGKPTTTMYEPDLSPSSGDPGSRLHDVGNGQTMLTIQGELDKLAANISIGRNMAGVHYYSDYYDSIRMGERITVGILLEQAPTYGETVEMTFKSFDGDHITISGDAGSCPSLTILGKDGAPVQPDDWWLRHVPGREFSEDL